MNVLGVVRGKCTASILFAGAMLAGIAVMPAMAQDMAAPPPPPAADAPGPGGHGGHKGEAAARMKEMSDQLGLTPDQQQVFRQSMKDEREKMKALKDDTTVEGKAKRKQAMQIMADASATRRAALTEDQKPKYDAMMAEMRAKRKGAAGGEGDDAGAPPPPPPPGL